MGECSLDGNSVGPTGARAIAEAIAANEDTALMHLYGVELVEYRDILGSNECRDNEGILACLRTRRLAKSLKAARGGTR
jgi:hypothetical protein